MTSFPYEIVVVDNESEDDSVQVALDMGCRVYSLKRTEFSYGRALNFGISHCNGEIIMSISAHVLFLSDYFLEKIPAYFSDDKIAGLRFVLATSLSSVGESLAKGPVRINYLDDENFVSDNWTNFMVNHCSAFKRDYWKLFPFDEKMPDGEDKLWTLQLLKRGYSFLYNVPNFYVYNKVHSRDKKVKSLINALIAKRMVTGKEEKMYSMSYLRFIYMKSIEQLRAARVQIIIYSRVFRGVKPFYRKYKG